MDSIKDKIIMITGSTDGIGKLTAEYLSGMDANIIIHGRKENKCKKTVEEIIEKTGNDKIKYYVADLSSLEQVRKLSEDVKNDYDELHVLINNAGVLVGKDTNRRLTSVDGFELTFAVNYLAPFLLTQLLLPLLQIPKTSRIINVASIAQSPIDFDDVMLKKTYDGMRAYSQSKLSLIMFTFDLAEKLKKTGITVNCIHPGTLLNTKMVRESFGRAMGEASRGAGNIVYLAVSNELIGITGKYFDERKISRAKPQAYNKEVRKKLQKLSEELTGISR